MQELHNINHINKQNIIERLHYYAYEVVNDENSSYPLNLEMIMSAQPY